MLPFPSHAPYRIDQVSAAPLLVALLTAVILATATGMTLVAQGGRSRWWAVSGLVLLAELTVLFGLASWGTSDVTKLSHHFAFNTIRIRVEPFWLLAAPLIVQLPYRMALVHGLVSAGYAALGLRLALGWQALAWGPWWALLIVFSPFLQNFLQNGVSRQALMTLLLVPLFLWAGRLAKVDRAWMVLLTLLAATVHSSFLATALIALLPRALVGGKGPAPIPLSVGTGRHRAIALAIFLLAMGGVLVLTGPMMLMKFHFYTMKENFFNSYALSPQVVRLQLAMAMGMIMVCWIRRLSWRQLLACARTRQMATFGLLFLFCQLCLSEEWVPAFTSRFVDPTGLFLLVGYLAWLERYRARWAVLPALAVTLEIWLLQRLPASLTLQCGQDDAFLCLPDCWPWQVQWHSLS